MQESPESTPPAPIGQRPRCSGLATTSVVLAISGIVFGLFLVALYATLPKPVPEDEPQLVGVLQLAGVVLLPWLTLLAGLLAIILGGIAYSRSRKAPEQYGRGGFALAGIAVGCVSIVMLLAFPSSGRARAYRTYSPPTACVHNLRQIEAAKEQWAMENRKKAGDPVLDDQVNAYLKNSQRPACPSGGVYTCNAVGVKPACSLGPDPGHTL